MKLERAGKNFSNNGYKIKNIKGTITLSELMSQENEVCNLIALLSQLGLVENIQISSCVGELHQNQRQVDSGSFIFFVHP